jgi:hypothetical protein
MLGLRHKGPDHKYNVKGFQIYARSRKSVHDIHAPFPNTAHSALQNVSLIFYNIVQHLATKSISISMYFSQFKLQY